MFRTPLVIFDIICCVLSLPPYYHLVVAYLRNLLYSMSWILVGFLILEIFSITGFPKKTGEACDLILNNHVSSKPSRLDPDSKHSIPKHAQPALF